MSDPQFEKTVQDFIAQVDVAIAAADAVRGDDAVRVAHADSLLSALYMMRGHARDYLMEGILPDEEWPPSTWKMETWSPKWKVFFDSCRAVPKFIADYAKSQNKKGKP